MQKHGFRSFLVYKMDHLPGVEKIFNTQSTLSQIHQTSLPMGQGQYYGS